MPEQTAPALLFRQLPNLQILSLITCRVPLNNKGKILSGREEKIFNNAVRTQVISSINTGIELKDKTQKSLCGTQSFDIYFLLFCYLFSKNVERHSTWGDLNICIRSRSPPGVTASICRCCPVIADGLVDDQRPQGSNKEREEARSYGDGNDEVSMPSPTPTLLSFLIWVLLLAVATVCHFLFFVSHSRHTLDRSKTNAIKSLWCLAPIIRSNSDLCVCLTFILESSSWWCRWAHLQSVTGRQWWVDYTFLREKEEKRRKIQKFVELGDVKSHFLGFAL